MTISEELKAKILRYHHVEKWPVGTIVSQLGVHHTTVKRVLSETGVDKTKILVAPSMIDPYLGFILEQLKRYPDLTASRLYNMVIERGYQGGPDHFRHLISCYRPKKTAEAYLRLRTLPGEQSQIDWGHFGHMIIGSASRPLMAFVMVLSYSRKIFLHFFLNARTENLLRGHELAFNYFNGVSRVALYDNMKSLVLGRQGDAIHFNPTLLAFAAHYRFEPRPCAPYRGNEKGRVERAIRYIRHSFYAGRQYINLDDLNQQALVWCDTTASNRPCPEDKTKSVQATYLEEQPRLIPLPENPFPCDEVQAVSVGKTPYVRFDLNDYSVPHTQVRQSLTVRATVSEVSILEGVNVLAKHARSYDKGKQIECAEHIKALASHKRAAAQHRSQDRLTQAIDCGNDFLKQAALQGYTLASISKQLISLLDEYGAEDLGDAMKTSLANGSPHPNTVRLNLDKLRTKRQEEPRIPTSLSSNKKIKETIVKNHNLSEYDALTKLTTKKEKQ
jgi:transposase